MLFHRTVTDTVYRADIHISIGALADFKVWMRKRTGATDEQMGMARWKHALGKVIEHSWDDGGCEFFVWFPWVPTSQATIAHEAFHVTAQLLRSRSIPLNFDTEEAYAYHLGSVFDELTRAMADYDRIRAKQKAAAPKVRVRRVRR
jgi:hypothetical protein